MSDHDRFLLELEAPEQWKAAGLSSVCEITTYGYRPFPVTCQNQLPVTCDGRPKLCPVETHGKLVDYKSPRPADSFGNRPNPPYQPAAYFLFDTPGWTLEDVTCDCEIGDTPRVEMVFLPIRDIPGDLDCRTAADCYQKGSELQLDSARKIRYHEAACFAGSSRACSGLGTSLLVTSEHTQVRVEMAKVALARACYHGEWASCERMGQLFEVSVGGMSNSDHGLALYEELKAAKHWYYRACAGGVRSACDRREALSPLVLGFDQRRKECQAYSSAKEPERRRECDLAAVKWLAASRPAAPQPSARAQDASEQPNSDTVWGQESFARLFPTPAPGWSISELQVKALDGFMHDLPTFAGRAKPVRYQLSRTYSADARAIEMTIDSENLETAGLVLLAHGYSHQKDGKPVPLSAEKQPDRAQLLAAGVQPVMRTGHLAAELKNGSTSFLMLLLGDKGVLGLGCETTDSLLDVEALLERIDLSSLDRFARFDHRKPD